jgi:hypothetical protein
MKAFGKILLATSLVTAPAALAEELFTGENTLASEEGAGQTTEQPADEILTIDGQESAMWYGAWRCDSWPVFGPGFYYWVNYNAYIARDNAMAACQMNTGTNCYFRCYRI